jgi:hypothetical protein
MLRNLDKHQKYKLAYKPNDFYWGLGVEHETYIETNKLKQVSTKELKENRASERYCVNYYTIYNPEELHIAIDGLFDSDTKILLPILINSHTFQQADIEGEHRTTYERIPKPNKKFNGKTMFDWLKEQNSKFAEEYAKSYIFDGDTIEFTTQEYYKATVQDVINELITVENSFIRDLNALPSEGIIKTYGPFQLAQRNYPFASYLTNLKNNAMFNNGTIHVNITLPTQLDKNAEIADFNLFKKQHQNYARAFQWISPLFVAKYGSPDPLCESKTNGEKYSAGSQRIAASRYIGLGTYDTDEMQIGKILTQKKNTIKNLSWYESFHKKVDYKFLDELGLDINFNKHFCHGLEFRIFDSISMKELKELLTILVYLADFSLDTHIQNPALNEVWHKIAEKSVHDGKGYYMDVPDQNELYSIFKIPYLSKEPTCVTDVLDLIVKYLMKEYDNGICVRYMIKGDSIISSSIYDEPKDDLKVEIHENKQRETETKKTKEQIRKEEKLKEQIRKEEKLKEQIRKEEEKQKEQKRKEDKKKMEEEHPKKKEHEKAVINVSPKSKWCCC